MQAFAYAGEASSSRGEGVKPAHELLDSMNSRTSSISGQDGRFFHREESYVYED
jgi:hypothetical protein